MAQFDPQNLDTNVVNLAKAIREHETGNRPVSGATGELASRYQYMPATWKSTAAKYLGDANAPLTAKNEDQATYLKIKDWKDSGYTPKQIASMWNSGNPDPYAKGNKGVGKSSTNPNVTYNVPKYVDSVYSKFEKFSQENAPSKFQPRLAPAPQPQQPGLLSQIGSALAKPYKNISETIGGALGLGTNAYQEAQKSQQDLADMNLKLVSAIKANKAQGKDTSRLEAQLAQNASTGNLAEQVAPTSTSITGKELAGSLGQVGLDILTAGTYGAAAKGAKTGELIGKTALEATKKSLPTATGILRPTLKSVGTGAALGAGYGATGAMQENEGIGGILGGAATGALIGGALSGAGSALSKARTATTDLAKSNKAVEAYKSVINPGKGELKKIELRRGENVNDTLKLIAEEGPTIKADNGKLNTIDAIDKMKEAIAKPSGELTELLKTQPKTFNLDELALIAKKEINDANEAAILKSSKVSLVDEIVNAEKEAFGSNLVPSSEANLIKQRLWSLSKFDSTFQSKPEIVDVARKLGYVIKDSIEKAYPEANVKELNNLTSRYITAIKLLENAHGRAVKGGFMSKAVSRIAGTMAGATLPIPVVGPLIGERLASIASDIMTNPERITSMAAKKYIKYGEKEGAGIMKKALEARKKIELTK